MWLRVRSGEVLVKIMTKRVDLIRFLPVDVVHIYGIFEP